MLSAKVEHGRAEVGEFAKSLRLRVVNREALPGVIGAHFRCTHRAADSLAPTFVRVSREPLEKPLDQVRDVIIAERARRGGSRSNFGILKHALLPTGHDLALELRQEPGEASRVQGCQRGTPLVPRGHVARRDVASTPRATSLWSRRASRLPRRFRSVMKCMAVTFACSGPMRTSSKRRSREARAAHDGPGKVRVPRRPCSSFTMNDHRAAAHERNRGAALGSLLRHKRGANSDVWRSPSSKVAPTPALAWTCRGRAAIGVMDETCVVDVRPTPPPQPREITSCAKHSSKNRRPVFADSPSSRTDVSKGVALEPPRRVNGTRESGPKGGEEYVQ